MTKKKKEKTAQNKGQWITYVVYMLLGAACGIFDLMYMDTAGQSEKGLFSEIIPLAFFPTKGPKSAAGGKPCEAFGAC